MFGRFIVCVVLCATLASAQQNSSCLEPYPILTSCSIGEMVQYFQFSSTENRCVRGPSTCPVADNSTSNAFPTLADCESGCPASSCSLPSEISNGMFNKVIINGQQMLRYACDTGYQLVGKEERVCLYNGTWNGSEPQCQRKECALPDPPTNGNFEKITLPNYTILRYTCNSGYVLIGPSERSCYDSSWTGEEPRCVDPSEVTCPDPDNVPMADQIKINCPGKAQKPGCFLMYTCQKNYNFISGNLWRRCDENGQWSGEQPICGRIFVTHDDKEVTEINANEGDKNIQINCKMEPSFPTHSNVEWSPIGDKTSWVDNKTAYALQFQVMHFQDAGEYTCSVTVIGSRNIKRRIAIKVLSSPTTVTQIPPTSAITRPQDIARITPSLIELTCVFSGLPKPNVTWYKGNETVRSIGNVNVQDKVPTNPEFTFSVLTIDNPTPSQFDTYTCKAANGVGELAYDIIASEPAKRKRSVQDQSQISTDKKVLYASFCTDDSSIVFVGKYRRQLEDSEYHVTVDKILPSRYVTSYFHYFPKVIKLYDPRGITASLAKQDNNNNKDFLQRTKQYIFIATSNGYELSNVYPLTMEQTFIKACSS